jgi:hypothetical protein
VVRFPESGPCIPLRLTSISATPDMRVYAWVLGSHRAVSTNYLDVELNEAAIDWFRGGFNYGAVATEAVDEATGRAYVTEYAGQSSILAGAFYQNRAYDYEALRTVTDPLEFVNRLYGSPVGASALLAGLIQRFVPMPQELVDAGVDPTSFYSCLDCYADALSGVELDASGFVDAVLDVLVHPLQHIQIEADLHPYLTRLFTIISGDEMTVDPIFRFNPDVPDVSNVHQAYATRFCGDGGIISESPVRLTLPDGTSLVFDPGDSGYPPFDSGGGLYFPGTAGGPVAEGMPGARRARALGEAGQGDLMLDNGDAIDRAIAACYSPAPEDGLLGVPGATGFRARGGGGLCTMVGEGTENRGGILVLIALVLGAVLVSRRL